MWVWDAEFKVYAKGEYAIDWFIEQFVVTRMDDHKIYKINNIEYYKYDNGGQHWLMNGILRRDDGPAVICADGKQYWYKDGVYHRDDGPAIINVNGYKAYYQDGKRHRLNGPAVEYSDDTVEYWENGVWIK